MQVPRPCRRHAGTDRAAARPTQRLLRAAAMAAAARGLGGSGGLPLTAAEAEAAVAPAVAAGLLRRTARPGGVPARPVRRCGVRGAPGAAATPAACGQEVLAATGAAGGAAGAAFSARADWNGGPKAEQAADAAVAAGDHLTAAGLLDPLTVALPLPQRARVVRSAPGGAVPAGDDPRGPDHGGAARLLTEARRRSHNGRAAYAARPVAESAGGRRGYLELARAIRHLHGAPVKAQSMINWVASPAWPYRTCVGCAGPSGARPRCPPSTGWGCWWMGSFTAAGAESGGAGGQLPETGHNLAELLHLSRGHLNIGDAAIHWGRDGHARELLQRALALARTHRLGRVEEITLATLVRLDWFAGAWRDLAVRAAALVEADRVERVAQLEAMLVLGWLALAQGEWEQSAQQLEEVLAEARRRGVIPLELSAAAGLGRLRLDEGDPVAAQRITDAAIELLVGKRIWVWAAELLPVRVEALVRTGQVAAAEAGGRGGDGVAGSISPGAAGGAVDQSRGGGRSPGRTGAGGGGLHARDSGLAGAPSSVRSAACPVGPGSVSTEGRMRRGDAGGADGGPRRVGGPGRRRRRPTGGGGAAGAWSTGAPDLAGWPTRLRGPAFSPGAGGGPVGGRRAHQPGDR